MRGTKKHTSVASRSFYIGIAGRLLFVLVAILLVRFSFAETTPTGCTTRTPVEADRWGGMTYVNYDFKIPDINTISHDIDVLNSPATNSDFYIQLYDANIGGSGQYYGIQTTGTVIWSRFGTRDQANIRSGSSSTKLDSNSEGDYISLRRSYGSLPSGHYKTRIVRAEFDGVGDWFKYYVTFPGRNEDYIGDMRFPRETAGVPAAFHDGGGQWNEFWDMNSNTHPLPVVPQLKLNVSVTANNGVVADTAHAHYSRMPNSDMYAIAPGGQVHHEMGANTPRCHQGDANGNFTLWQGVKTAPPPTTPPPALNTPPTVSLSSSASSLVAPANFNLTAAANDPDGIAKVVFTNTSTGATSTATNAPYVIAFSNYPAGTYTFTATAYDKNASPLSKQSAPVAVTVQPKPATPPPAIGETDTTAPKWPNGSKISFSNLGYNWFPSFQPCNSFTACRIDLSWPTATDNVRVTQYQIWRGVGNGTKTQVGTVIAPVQRWTDTSVANSVNYNYSVIASDGRNLSIISAATNIGCWGIFCSIN